MAFKQKQLINRTVFSLQDAANIDFEHGDVAVASGLGIFYFDAAHAGPADGVNIVDTNNSSGFLIRAFPGTQYARANTNIQRNVNTSPTSWNWDEKITSGRMFAMAGSSLIFAYDAGIYEVGCSATLDYSSGTGVTVSKLSLFNGATEIADSVVYGRHNSISDGKDTLHSQALVSLPASGYIVAKVSRHSGAGSLIMPAGLQNIIVKRIA